ncbi:amino acid permease [candidate division KSB1 bacterium]
MNNNVKRFGTFEGVFTPTILTILGVIMYLRLGWVVGNAGFGGALLIIILAKMVTITTGLAISSMTTNIRIGAGGTYALISRSLGAEVGSAIGIPLYLSITFGAAMYIIGFTEAWVAIFPSHNVIIVSTVVLVFLFIVSMTSAKIAMKVQYIIMAIITASLISFFLGKMEGTQEIIMWGSFSSAPFWIVFSIFFPAVTGIEAGAAMSGDLENPKKSLPIGILSAIFISLIVYIAVAFWLDSLSTPDALTKDYTIMFKLSRWRILIIAGVLGATLSSALGSIVGGPRTLMALGQDRVLPFSKFFAKLSKNSEPRNSIIFTGIIIEICLLSADLNTIAPLLTMFFLIAYGVINVAVFIEKAIGIPSFRPSFRIPIIIPLVGSLWCLSIMFLINPVFAAVALVFIVIVYVVQIKRRLRTPWGDVRSGLFNAIAEWAVKTSAHLPRNAKSWKPNLMIPIEDPKNWVYLMDFVRDMVFPKGTLRLFSVKILEEGVEQKINIMRNVLFRKEGNLEKSTIDESEEELETQLKELYTPIEKEGIFTAATIIESHNFLEGISIITQVMRGMFFPPNTIFLTMSADRTKDNRLEEMTAISVREKLGIIILSLHPKAGFGKKERINVWVHVGSPNRDLAILIAMQLAHNWNGNLRLISVAKDDEELDTVTIALHKMTEYARIPSSTEIHILKGDFKETINDAPAADINIFGIPKDLKCDTLHEISEITYSSCLFVKDSGEESIFA